MQKFEFAVHDGQPLPFHRLTTPTAYEFAELHLIAVELDEALSNLDYYEQTGDTQSSGTKDGQQIHRVRAAVFRDIIVQLVACFGSNGLNVEKVFNGDSASAYLKWLTDVRNTYAAHRQGPMRQCDAVAAFDHSKESAHSTGHLIFKYLGVDLPDVVQLRSFIRTAHKWTIERTAVLHDILDAEVNAMSVVERNKLPLSQLGAPDPKKLKAPRLSFAAMKTVNSKA